MPNISCIIVDDEPNNVDYLHLLIRDQHPELEVLATASSPSKAVTVIKQHKPSLVFLDVEMPGMSGFDMLQQLEPLSFEVIFVTAHSEYALQAFDVYAIGYLTKPVEEGKLAQAIAKARERIEQKFVHRDLFSLLQQTNSAKATEKLALPTQNGLQFIRPDDILHCDSNGNYTWFHLKDAGKILVSRQLGEYEKLLPNEQFVRIHDKHIINLKYLTEYLKGSGGEVRLDNGIQLPVSTRRKEDLLNRFDKWLKRK